MGQEIPMYDPLWKQKRLDATNSEGWSKYTEHHWYRNLGGYRIQFWPSTRKYEYRGKYMFGDANAFVDNTEIRLLARPHDWRYFTQSRDYENGTITQQQRCFACKEISTNTYPIESHPQKHKERPKYGCKKFKWGG